ncbi:acyltransferase domain-containing protein [Streptomyces sp. NBC_00140]|uniref:acyltransferase domain-containing protein n=1 Tax=Streptomyces sp. NBC_00140 TaxID=2975664 RepID=UPI00224FCB91|nr:acyltransferase domain-containing protein [Streptomyces sp. NBC_00140]MCX5329397.1 acyltransferase domain-containing protein [Streptomyces sp. NBC_00140]
MRPDRAGHPPAGARPGTRPPLPPLPRGSRRLLHGPAQAGPRRPVHRLLESQGLRPDVLFGYSAGHMAAAHAAGVFSLADACRAVGTLSRLVRTLPEGGCMAAVEAGPQELRLGPGAVVAAVNGPRSVVVAGDREAVTALCAQWSARGRRTHVLRVDAAPHPPLFEPLLADYHRTLLTMELHVPRIPLVSDTTAEPVTRAATEPGYWVRAPRRPVRFADAVARLHAEGTTTYVELGPGEVLTGMLDACLPRGAGRPLLLSVTRNWRALRKETDVA